MQVLQVNVDDYKKCLQKARILALEFKMLGQKSKIKNSPFTIKW